MKGPPEPFPLNKAKHLKRSKREPVIFYIIPFTDTVQSKYKLPRNFYIKIVYKIQKGPNRKYIAMLKWVTTIFSLNYSFDPGTLLLIWNSI